MEYYNYPPVNDGYFQAENGSMADGKSELYPHDHYRRSNGEYMRQKREKQSRRNSERSFTDQNYHLPPTMPNDTYDHPLSVKNYYNRRYSSYDDMADPSISPNNRHYHQQSYQDDFNYFSNNPNKGLKNKKYTKSSYQEYPTTPEDEKNGSRFLRYNNDQYDATTPVEAATYGNQQDLGTDNDIFLQNQDMGDDEEGPFIEDTTTQRNTLMNAEPAMTIDQDFPLYQQHQQQSSSPSTEEKKNLPLPIAEKKKWYKSIIASTALVFKKKLGTGKQTILSLPQTTSPAIQVITATNNDMLGDVLDSQQQKEIFSQLSSPQPSIDHVLSPEKTKITNLERIWVFRLIEEGLVPDNIAWIGFDFENQLKIEQHLKDLESRPEDGRLAVYDSHIRHKTMPVIVTPNENKGYYFSDIHQNELITLEVTFIENHHQKITFVYRV